MVYTDWLPPTLDERRGLGDVRLRHPAGYGVKAKLPALFHSITIIKF